MRTPYGSIAALLLSVLFLIAGNALLNTLAPLRGKIEGFSNLTLGVLGSVYFGGMLAGTLLGPMTIRMFGHIRAYGIYTALAIIAALSLALSKDATSWMLSRAVIGFSFAGLYGVIESWVQGKADNTYRGRLGAAYQFIHSAAVAGGQSMLIMADPRSFTLFALAAMLFALSILPFSMSRTDPPALPESARLDLFWLRREAPVSVATAAAVGSANGAFWAMTPVYATSIGLPPAALATFLSSAVLGALIAIWPLGFTSDRTDRRYVLAGLALSAAIVELALLILGRLPGWGMNALGVLLGGLILTMYSIASAHANDRAGPGQSVTIASTMLFLYSCGAVAGPLAASVLMERLGPQGLFLFMAAIHAPLAAYALVRIKRRSAPESRSSFEPEQPV
jgi:MFS family permease